jgi:membrane-associated phospholipid phosphatase
MTRRALVAVLILGLVTPAAAEDPPQRGPEIIPGHAIDRRTAGGITGLAIGLGLVSQLIPIRSPEPWSSELFGADEGVRDNFAPRAMHIADAMVGLSLAAPAIYLVGATIDDADGDRLLLYGQSVAINALLAGTVKRLVQRPRPYTYSRDPLARKFAKAAGDDAYLSFYSGHSALSFGAAVTGAYLVGASGDSATATSVAWGSGLAIAAATATMQVRAGKHFPSDVVIGSAVGIAVGYLVPALHADGKPYTPSGQDVAAAATGIVGGILLSSLVPLGKRRSELDDKPPVPSLGISPMAVQGGGFGFAITGGM